MVVMFEQENAVSVNSYQIYIGKCHTFSIFAAVSTQFMTGIKKKNDERMISMVMLVIVSSQACQVTLISTKTMSET